jgi:hypothetical protein
MHGPINVKSPNNTSKWQMGFNSAFKGLNLISATEFKLHGAVEMCPLYGRVRRVYVTRAQAYHCTHAQKDACQLCLVSESEICRRLSTNYEAPTG